VQKKIFQDNGFISIWLCKSLLDECLGEKCFAGRAVPELVERFPSLSSGSRACRAVPELVERFPSLSSGSRACRGIETRAVLHCIKNINGIISIQPPAAQQPQPYSPPVTLRSFDKLRNQLSAPLDERQMRTRSRWSSDVVEMWKCMHRIETSHLYPVFISLPTCFSFCQKDILYSNSNY